MSAVRRISDAEYASRMDYLIWTAGADLHHELVNAQAARNYSKAAEVARLVSKHAREVALYLEGREAVSHGNLVATQPGSQA